MRRREFLRNSTRASVLAGLGFGDFSGAGFGRNVIRGRAAEAGDSAAPIGRPVRVISIGFKARGSRLGKIVEVVDSEGARGADVIVLPEACRGMGDEGSTETLSGPTVTAMAALAKKHRTYIVCPIDRKYENGRHNSAVLLDRFGRVATVYNKIFPWFPEFRVSPAVEPGKEVGVHQADFGRLGLAICFDIDFPEVWQALAYQGAELVVWPSAYSGGAALRAHAIRHHYYIVSATQAPDCTVYDITGEELLYQRSSEINVSRITLDLDRGVYDRDAIDGREKCGERKARLLKEHGNEIVQEKYLEREDWFVLRAKCPGVSSRELARRYGLVEKADLVRRSRTLIDQRRGWAFAERVRRTEF